MKLPSKPSTACVTANARLHQSVIRHSLLGGLVAIALSATTGLQAQSVAEQTEGYAHCTTGISGSGVTGSERYSFDRLANTYPKPELKDSVILTADTAESDPADPEQILLNGAISIEHSEGSLRADNARYDPRTDTATVEGKMVYESAGLQVHSSDASLNVKEGTFVLGESGYELNNTEVVSQGRAEQILRDIKGNLELHNATYSSCPPGDNGWLIRADKIKLDSEEGVGTARDITLRFKDVPIFYAPLFSFPISNQRKTGFLTPRFDQNDKTGIEYRQPFYWNIKPDWDATFVLRSMSERGIQVQSELRHLNHIGTWMLNHEYISNDDRYIPGENRYFARFQHLGGLGRRWTTLIDLSTVGDKDYFEDLGDTLKIASITHLQRRADLVYTARNYVFRTRLLSYKTVDENIAPDQRPYKQLPQLTLNYKKSYPQLGIDATVDSEWVYFERDNSVNGRRFDITPRVEWNKKRAAWFSTLAASLRHTHYDLNSLDSETRTVPVFSADTGMYFDRFNATDGSLLTLEPRLFYLHANHTDQNDLPVFDTGALDFNFSQLFRENRFSGSDRINDANQLSFALSSRLINNQGREKFQASIGQILYFDDREVTLPDGAPETTSSSDIVAELKLEFDQNWSGETATQWNPATATTERSSAAIRYRDGTDRLVNIGHRYLRDEGEFINASFAWPIKNNWRLASGWSYSLDDKKSIETVLGLEYDSCCWAFRTAARRYITDDGQDKNTAYFFQLVLKGLAPVGQNVTEVLREAVGGYTDSND